MWGRYSRQTLEIEQHPGIAEGIGLYRLEIKEFGNTCVVGAQKLLIDIGVNGCAVNLFKSMTTKEGRKFFRRRLRVHVR